MRKNVFGRQFKRDTNERKALFKGLISSLVLYGKIETTEEKAKAIKGQVDKLVTRLKRKPVNNLNNLSFYLNSEALKKFISNISLFENRNGGYTRLMKLGRRFSDNAKMVLMEWVKPEISNTKDQIAKIEKTAKKENKKTATTEEDTKNNDLNNDKTVTAKKVSRVKKKESKK